MATKIKNPWDAWWGLDDLLAGKNSDLDWEAKLNKGEGIVGGVASHNDPVVAATYGAFTAPPNHWVWDDWRKYFDMAWMTGETGSRFVYGLWILGSVWTLWAILKHRGIHPDIMESARMHARATAAWLALTSWPWGQGKDGPHFTCMTGSRSGISHEGEDGKRYDSKGMPNELYFVDGNPLDGLTQIADRAVPFKGTTTRKRYDLLRKNGVKMEEILSLGDWDIFHKVLMDGTASKVRAISTWLTDIPGPKVPLRTRRLENGIVSICEASTHPTSTAMLYGMAYFADVDGPPPTWQDQLRWPTKPVVWMAADNIAQRGKGKHGTAGLDDGSMWCQRVQGNWWHPIKKDLVPGKNVLPVPQGNFIFEVQWFLNHASVTTGQDPIPDDNDSGNWCDWFGDLFGQ